MTGQAPAVLTPVRCAFSSDQRWVRSPTNDLRLYQPPNPQQHPVVAARHTAGSRLRQPPAVYRDISSRFLGRSRPTSYRRQTRTTTLFAVLQIDWSDSKADRKNVTLGHHAGQAQSASV